LRISKLSYNNITLTLRRKVKVYYKMNEIKEEPKLLTMEEIRKTPMRDKCSWADCLSPNWYYEYCIREESEEVLNEFLYENREYLT
jgi:hypothetical protein